MDTATETPINVDYDNNLSPDTQADQTPTFVDKTASTITQQPSQIDGVVTTTPSFLERGETQTQMPTEAEMRKFTQSIEAMQQKSDDLELQNAGTSPSIASPSPDDYSIINEDGSRKVFAPKKMWDWKDDAVGRFMAECEAAGIIPNEHDSFITMMGKTITMPLKMPLKALQYFGGKLKERVTTLFKKTSQPQKENARPSSMTPLSGTI